MTDSFTLLSPDDRAHLQIDAERGGRIGSFAVDGHELLAPPAADPLLWGCYPMVPFAGRIRHGRLRFDGVEHQLDASYGGHAMHGSGFTRPWTRADDNSIALTFDDAWPFSGQATQDFALTDGTLELTIKVTAWQRQPINIGWHPWFLRDIGLGSHAELEFAAGRMYVRDDEGLPSGELIAPPIGPWDDCFTDLAHPPVIRWGSSFALRLSSSVDHWVVFDEPQHAFCVEPQSGPPNDANDSPRILEDGEEFAVTFTLEW